MRFSEDDENFLAYVSRFDEIVDLRHFFSILRVVLTVEMSIYQCKWITSFKNMKRFKIRIKRILLITTFYILWFLEWLIVTLDLIYMSTSGNHVSQTEKYFCILCVLDIVEYLSRFWFKMKISIW